MLKIQGRYLSGKTSKHELACLEVFSDQSIFIVTSNPEKRMRFERSDLKIASRLGRTAREISLGDNHLFITDEHDAVDKLARTVSGQKHAVLHRLESNLPAILVALVLTVLLVSGGTIYGVPKAAEIIAHKFPDFTIEKFGEGLAVLDETLFEPSKLDAEEKQRIVQVFQPFLEAHAALKPRVYFRSGIGPNALALPNGEIIFTDEFIALAENDNELIAVLLHELGHLKHKHIARRAIQDAMITLMTLFIIGDLSSVDMVSAIPTLLLDLSYSRDFEREADQYAVEQLLAAEIPVGHFAAIMQKLHDHGKEQQSDETGFELPRYLSTHPAAAERISLIKERAGSQNQEATPPTQ